MAEKRSNDKTELELIKEVFGEDAVFDPPEKYRKLLEKNILETNDENAKGILAKFETANSFFCYKNYEKIFGLCRLLGLTDIYDIGCSDNYQAFLLINHPDMSYTGFDCDSNIGFTYINDITAKCGDGNRIKHRIAEYPFPITASENNVAILLGCIDFTMNASEESVKNTTTALSRDFGRIIMSSIHKNVKVWETGLREFEMYKIDSYIFGTKFPKDISVLESAGYDFYDKRFTIGNVDKIYAIKN